MRAKTMGFRGAEHRETWKETDINAPMTKSAENQKSNRK